MRKDLGESGFGGAGFRVAESCGVGSWGAAFGRAGYWGAAFGV